MIVDGFLRVFSLNELSSKMNGNNITVYFLLSKKSSFLLDESIKDSFLAPSFGSSYLYTQ